mgnify:FL=1
MNSMLKGRRVGIILLTASCATFVTSAILLILPRCYAIDCMDGGSRVAFRLLMINDFRPGAYNPSEMEERTPYKTNDSGKEPRRIVDHVAIHPFYLDLWSVAIVLGYLGRKVWQSRAT